MAKQSCLALINWPFLPILSPLRQASFFSNAASLLQLPLQSCACTSVPWPNAMAIHRLRLVCQMSFFSSAVFVLQLFRRLCSCVVVSRQDEIGCLSFFRLVCRVSCFLDTSRCRRCAASSAVAPPHEALKTAFLRIGSHALLSPFLLPCTFMLRMWWRRRRCNMTVSC